MMLTYREATLGDLVACVDTLRHHYGNDPEIVPHLPEFWERLQADRTMLAGVIEDRAREPGDRIISLGAGVFITEEFAAEAKRGDVPFISAQIVRRVLRGDSPVLSLRAIRRANAQAGLTLCTLHTDYRRPPQEFHPDPRVWEKHTEMFFHMVQGYRFREYLQEVYGEFALRWMLTSGLKLRTDYAPFYAARPAPPADRRPYLTGLTREEANAEMGSRAQRMFVYTPPRFEFTAGEQELLRHALEGETDEELSRSLSVSLSTVKKRWAALYERVSEVDPLLLNPEGETEGSEGRRGAERRRHLLNYVREHPEELQPVSASK